MRSVARDIQFVVSVCARCGWGVGESVVGYGCGEGFFTAGLPGCRDGVRDEDLDGRGWVRHSPQSHIKGPRSDFQGFCG